MDMDMTLICQHFRNLKNAVITHSMLTETWVFILQRVTLILKVKLNLIFNVCDILVFFC